MTVNVGDRVLVETTDGDSLEGRVIVTAPLYIQLHCPWGTAHVQRDRIAATRKQRPQD